MDPHNHPGLYSRCSSGISGSGGIWLLALLSLEEHAETTTVGRPGRSRLPSCCWPPPPPPRLPLLPARCCCPKLPPHSTGRLQAMLPPEARAAERRMARAARSSELLFLLDLREDVTYCNSTIYYISHMINFQSVAVWKLSSTSAPHHHKAKCILDEIYVL